MRLVFLFDVDNTLLDTDRVTADLRAFVTNRIGAEQGQMFFALFEKHRAEMGYADYLGALERYRDANPHHAEITQVSLFLLNYHFANRLFPGALDAVEHAKTLGTTVILSDGDVVFQPFKIENAGLWEEFNGNVLIYIHKERELAAIQERFPADHYIMMDDKLRILDAMKKVWGNRLTTVFVRQGHYAHDPKHLAGFMPADVTLEHIADLLGYDAETLVAASHRAADK
ncbi:MAG: HAD family hydrolase [Anaerolineae bacterium]|nr:HAD family hydrolase [Anaerolineae bacterium]